MMRSTKAFSAAAICLEQFRRPLRVATLQRFRAAALLEHGDDAQPQIRIVDGGEPFAHIRIAPRAEFAEHILIDQIGSHGILRGTTSVVGAWSSNAPRSANSASARFRLRAG